MRVSKHLSPGRPSVPPLFFVALGMWAGCAAAILAFGGQERGQVLSCGLVAVLCALPCLAALYRFGLQGFFLLATGAFLGVASASWACANTLAWQQHQQSLKGQEYRVQVLEDAHSSSFGTYCTAVAYDHAGVAQVVRLNIPRNADVHCWDVFCTSAALKMPSDAVYAYYWEQGVAGSLSPSCIEAQAPLGLLGAIAQLREYGIGLYAGFEDSSGYLLRSIACGDRRDLLESSFYHQVKRAGLAHMVAISGAHLSICLSAFSILLGKLRAPRFLSLFLQMALCVCYVLFAGAPHSALRSCVMALCMLAAYFGKRRSFSLNALSLAVLCFLAFRPNLCFSVSLQLSSLATAGIIIFGPWFGALAECITKGCFSQACKLLGMTFAAMLSTAPVSIALFGQISLVAPLSNLMLAPVFTLVCVCGIAVLPLCHLLPVCLPLIGAVHAMASVFCAIVELLSRIPFAATVAYAPACASGPLFGAAALALFIGWPPPTRRLALVLVAASVALGAANIFLAPVIHGPEIVMLDVGQGDSFLVRNGKRGVLIDTGNQDALVLSALARHDVRTLDAIIITHSDDDHCGSLDAILSYVEVEGVYVAEGVVECPCAKCAKLRSSLGGVALHGLGAGDGLEWACFEAHVLHPESLTAEGGNEDSLVLSLSCDADADGHADATALFCGDAEQEVLDLLLRKGRLRAVDILKVGHHGSGGALNANLLDKLKPSVALVSVGRGNRYGHPSQETVGLLEEAGAAVCRSDECGDLVCNISNEGIKVRSLR